MLERNLRGMSLEAVASAMGDWCLLVGIHARVCAGTAESLSEIQSTRQARCCGTRKSVVATRRRRAAVSLLSPPPRHHTFTVSSSMPTRKQCCVSVHYAYNSLAPVARISESVRPFRPLAVWRAVDFGARTAPLNSVFWSKHLGSITLMVL
jgi:hypothetical protein